MIIEVTVDGIDQVGNAFENATANAFVGDLAEPTLDQIQPGTGSWNKVQMETWMPFQPEFDPWMFVGAVIVDNEMEIEAGRSIRIDFVQEPDKLLMSVTGHAIADHSAVEHAQGRKQSGGAIALVIVSHGPATALLDRQPRLCAVESLNLALLVHAKDQGFDGWVQVKADDIGEFLHKVLVAAELECFYQMGFQIMLIPDPLDGHTTQALGLSHGAYAPVSGVSRLGMKGSFNNGVNLSLRDFRESARTRGIFFQTGQAKRQKTLSPELNSGPRSFKALSDLLAQDPFGRHLDNLGPLYQTQRKASSIGPGAQRFTFVRRQDDGLCHSHAGGHRAYFDISKEINGTLH